VATTIHRTPATGRDAVGDEAGEPAAETRSRRRHGDSGPIGTGRPPAAVWLAALLLGLVGALWTVAQPHYRAPDEAAHVDLVLHLAEGNPYPSFDGRRFGEEIGLDDDRYLIDLAIPWPRFDEADAPPRSRRPDVDDLGGTTPDDDARRLGSDGSVRAGYPYVYNQMPQHPPLYYEAMATVLRVERWVLPGDDLPSLDREIGLLRLANVLLLVPLPLLAWAIVRRLGGDDRAGTVAAVLPLCVPQLSHIGAAVNNDNLFALVGAGLAVLLAGVARGRRTRATDVGVGVVLGLALLTKAFAVMFVPWVVIAYLVGWRTTRGRRPVVPLALTGVVALAVGGWWWLANWVREGEPAPTTESLTRTTADRPDGFSPDRLSYAWTFAGRMVTRSWAWVGFGTPKFDLPVALVALAVGAILVATVVALRHARPGLRLAAGDGLRRIDVALAWLPVILLVAFVYRRAWGLFETTGRSAFVQGRYLFGVGAAPAAVAAIGAVRLHRRAGVAVVGLAAVLQGWMLADVVRGSWSGEGRLGALDGMLAWSPWPAAAVVSVAGAATVVTVLLAVMVWRSAVAQPSSPTKPSGGPIGESVSGAGSTA
jgi:small subunit ribosomal protein S36